MLNGMINFLLAQFYFIIAEILVKWENHPYENHRLNSLVMKKVVFKIYASFFTLVIQSFNGDFDVLSN